MEITQNQIGTLKRAVDFLRAGFPPDKNHRPVLADAINAALELLEATEPFEPYNPEIFDECGGVRLDLIKPKTTEPAESEGKWRQRIVQAAGTESIEDILLMIRNGKRHVECVREQTHAEPIKRPSDEVAKRISEINS